MALKRAKVSAQISSLDENNKRAETCKLFYAPTRNAVLRAHPWNFAIKREALSATTDTPAFEYTYQFTLPVDYLKLVQTSLESSGFYSTADYRVEGRFLLSNESAISIEYIAEIEDVAQFDALFVDVFAQRLAAEIAPDLTDNTSLTQMLWQVYDAKLSESRGVDAQEGIPRDFEADQWIVERA